MKRREFIKLVGGASAIPAFSVARSQEPMRTRRIGILSDSLADRWQGGWRAFFEELAAGGFIEGTNLQVDRRGFSPTTLDTVATELARARPEVILALAPPAGRSGYQRVRRLDVPPRRKRDGRGDLCFPAQR